MIAFSMLKRFLLKFSTLMLSALVGLMICSSFVWADNSHKIRVVVGDAPITNYHIRQRVNLHLMSSKQLASRLRAKLKAKSTQTRWRAFLKKSKPQSKEEVARLQKRFVARLQNEARSGVAKGVRKKVLDELIDERLKVNSAKAQNIIISKAVLDNQIAQIAARNSKGVSTKKATKAFYASLAGRGVGKATFRSKIKAQMAWQQLVRRKFGREVTFGDRDVEQQLGFDTTTVRNRKIEFSLRKVIITIANQKDQAQVVKQYLEADAIRKRFNGCANMKSLLAPYKGAKSINLGRKTLDKIPSPVNLILSDMKVGEITPPQATDKGLEMYAVCERKQVTIDDTQRRKVLGKLRQEAYQLRSERYLKDLRDEAHIEYRD